MKTDSSVSRRTYLAGVSGSLSLAGCLGWSSGDDGDSLVETPALVNLALQYIGIGTVVVDFEVEQDGELVHAESYELEGLDPSDVADAPDAGAIGSDVGDIVRFEGKPWMNERSTYAVTANHQGGGAGTYTTNDYLETYGDRDCPEFFIVVGVVQGRVEPRGGPAPPDCINPIPVP
jgi:hypothetical protein